jgi:hypothetical protein
MNMSFNEYTTLDYHLSFIAWYAKTTIFINLSFIWGDFLKHSYYPNIKKQHEFHRIKKIP